MNTNKATSKISSLRQQWMSTLATANFENLNNLWGKQDLNPSYQPIRSPEIGLAQVQARMGGTGDRFNVTDITVTRCVIKLNSGELGYSYLAGRHKPHAELAAVIDALMQLDAYQQVFMDTIIQPLQMERKKKHLLRQQQVSNSKVDFFTLVRGDD